MVMHSPAVLAGVSPAVQAILASQFGRRALLLPNGVDCRAFAPGPREPEAPAVAFELRGVSKPRRF
jgi:hypothetical protein